MHVAHHIHPKTQKFYVNFKKQQKKTLGEKKINC